MCERLRSGLVHNSFSWLGPSLFQLLSQYIPKIYHRGQEVTLFQISRQLLNPKDFKNLS